VAFFFGTAQFILGSRDANPDKMKNGKQFMLWGVIALFVAFSVYGIIIFFQGTLGIQGKTDIKIPRVIFDGSSSSNGQTPTGNGGLPTGGNQLSCPANGYATNCATYAALNCGQIRCTLGNADGYCQGTSCVPVSNGNAECAGKPVGQGCTTGGRPGTCGYDDQGTFGCYALSGVNLNKKANGVSCTSGSECNSGYCDSVANVCADLP
jgi:hypothetical protein